MSVADIVTSMQQIQAQLALLQSGPGPSSSASAANATSFAAALDGASAIDGTGAVTDSGSTVASGSITGKDVVQGAMRYVGTPYRLGGESKAGIDCSGLVQRAFGDLGVKVPRLVHEQQTIGHAVPSLQDAKPGDLVVLNGGDHIAIWMGNNTVIHAPYEGRTVSVQKAWFTDKDVVTIRRVVPSEAPAATTLSAAPLIAPASVAARSSLSSVLGGLSEGGASTSSPSLSSLLSTLGTSGSTGSGTAQQLLAARAALMEGAA